MKSTEEVQATDVHTPVITRLPDSIHILQT